LSFGILSFGTLGFGAFDFLAGRAALATFAAFFGSERTEVFLARWARMIFAMNGIY
jgi:hypothetical protein